MKPSSRHILILAVIAIMATLWVPAKAANTAYTCPVGYEYLKAHRGKYNLLALRLHQATVVSGVFNTISATALSDYTADFDIALRIPKLYVVELIGGPMDGKVIDIVSFTTHTLTVEESLPTGSNILYKIRSVPRLSEIINPIEPLAVDDFNPDHGDLILLPSGDGQFNQYFSSSRIGHAGYFNAVTGRPEDPLLRYTEAFYYLRRGESNFEFVVSGEVKCKNTLLSVTDTFSYVGSVYPVITLGDTNLEASIQRGSEDTADIVWMQEASGGYKCYFYSNGTPPLSVGWREVGADTGFENQDQSAVSITSGLIIQRRAPLPYNALLTPPDGYSNL